MQNKFWTYSFGCWRNRIMKIFERESKNVKNRLCKSYAGQDGFFLNTTQEKHFDVKSTHIFSILFIYIY